jgi:hypothetical protein
MYIYMHIYIYIYLYVYIGGRTLRSDYADPSRKQNIKSSVDAPESGGAWQSGYTRGTVLGGEKVEY